MHIQCSDLGHHESSKRVNLHTNMLKLAYDAEGCGCIVSGMAQLWVVSTPDEYDVYSNEDPIPILYDSRHEVFFEESLKIDYQPKTRSFILKSNQQIYNSGMRLIERR